jgi:colicin import membrane protein
MRGELQRAESDLERLREAPRPKPPVVAPAPPPPPAAKEPEPAAPEPPHDEVLARRAQAAETRALTLEEQLVAARVDAERQRRKVAAHDRLYLALRGDLDAKKERLRTQQEELERLRALRLVHADDLVEPLAEPPAEEPAEEPAEPLADEHAEHGGEG